MGEYFGIMKNSIVEESLFPNTLITSSPTIDTIVSKTNPQTYYDAAAKYIGIVAKENSSYESGYEVAEHVAGDVTLIIVDTETGSKNYIPLPLGARREEGGEPGVKLVDIINNNYPEIQVLITGNILKVSGDLKNAINEIGSGDIDEVIKGYTKPSAEEIEEIFEHSEDYKGEEENNEHESRYKDIIAEETDEYISKEAECVGAPVDGEDVNE